MVDNRNTEKSAQGKNIIKESQSSSDGFEAVQGSFFQIVISKQMINFGGELCKKN